MILRITNLIALLLAEAWFIQTPDWEPAILFIGFLSSLIIQEVKTNKPEQNTIHDKTLFSKFLNALPSNEGSINFLREHDFHNTFELEKLNQLRTFAMGWDNVEYEFLNKKLEDIRKELMDLIYEFIDISSHATFPIRDGFQTAIPRYTEEGEIPQRAIDSIKSMNKLGDNIFEKHQELARLGKQQLNV